MASSVTHRGQGLRYNLRNDTLFTFVVKSFNSSTCNLLYVWVRKDYWLVSIFSCVRFDATSQLSWQKSHNSWTQSHGSLCSFSRQMTFCEVLNMSWVPRYRDDPTSPCRGTVCRPLESTRRRCLCHGHSGLSVGQEPTCLSSLWGCTKLGCGGKQFYHCNYLFIYLLYYLSSSLEFSVLNLLGPTVCHKVCSSWCTPPNLLQHVKPCSMGLCMFSLHYPNLHIWWSHLKNWRTLAPPPPQVALFQGYIIYPAVDHTKVAWGQGRARKYFAYCKWSTTGGGNSQKTRGSCLRKQTRAQPCTQAVH